MVKAVFAVYNSAMEARALALMGQKMKAGQTLYGDEVGGAIVPEDEGDLLLKLAVPPGSEQDRHPRPLAIPVRRELPELNGRP